MKIQDLKMFREQLLNTPFLFSSEIFNKAIWGDMGEDSAQISISVQKSYWHLKFIRTQSGDPSPFDDFVCNIIDEYEKSLNDDQIYDTLALHGLLAEFEHTCRQYTEVIKFQ